MAPALTGLASNSAEKHTGAIRDVESSLLQRVADGEVNAMQACMDEYGGLVWSLARRFCPVLSEAEDAVQDVFIALWQSADRFDPAKGTEVTFVAMIARRRLIDRGRRTARREKLMTELREAGQEESTTVTEHVAQADDVQKAKEAVEQLSPDQRRVLQLAVTHGYTHEQIAAMTELPLGTVKTHARRGLMKVRSLIADTQSSAEAAGRSDR